MTITILRVNGVGERPGPQLQLAGVTQHLDPRKYRVIDLPFSVTYGPIGAGGPYGDSYARSIEYGVHSVLNAINVDTNPVVLLGYSGGGTVAGHAAREIGLGKHPHLDVRAVGLVADPHQPLHVLGNAYGVAGNRDIPNIPTQWVYDRRDPIPATEINGPLRTLAKQTTAFSLGDPAYWIEDLLNKTRKPWLWEGNARDWRDPLGTIRRYQRAGDQALFYLTGGHVTAYRGEPLKQLAQWIETVT